MIRLSFIIPAYNVERSIQRTLKSIFSMPIPECEYEVIVVDDCSIDETKSIVEQIKGKHTNVILLHQKENLRQGAARNKGLTIAKGRYIAFCDADDSIVSDGLMCALKAVEKSKIDICYFDFEFEQSEGQWHKFIIPQEIRDSILSSDEYLNRYYTCYYNAPWRCLYRTDFLRSTGVRFVEGVRWEDCDWTVKIYAKAKKIQFVDGVGYRYAWNGDSTSRQFDAQAVSEQLMAGVRLLQFSREVEHSLPGLSKTLYEEGKYRYVIHNIRLRNLTKYRVSHICTLYKKVSKDDWNILAKIQLPIWEYIVVKHHALAIAFLCCACPVAALGRKLLDFKRNRI